MSASKYKFVSPGVFIDEIDNSQLNKTSNDVGPVIIGRSERGPALVPTKVSSFAEFVEVFGNPIAGQQNGDVWRDGNYIGPTYAPFAAQAYLKNASPVTFIRLLGKQHTNATTAGEAGWQTTDVDPSATLASNGGAFGLFLAPSASDFSATPTTGTLAAVFYLDASASIGLSGTLDIAGTANTASVTCKYLRFASLSDVKVAVSRSTGIVIDTSFDFTPTSDKFVRKVFNTNPILTNSGVSTSTVPYWLGETFESAVADLSTANGFVGVILPLMSGTSYGADLRKSYQEAKTGWFISQDLSSTVASYVAENMQKLFRFSGRNSGEWLQKNLKISIQDLKRSSDTSIPYGTFSVVIRKMTDTDQRVEIVEQFNNLDLNPASPNYIAKRIGDMYQVWDDTTRSYKEYGNHPNISNYVRVEMNSDVDAGSTNPEYLPWGVLGPIRFTSFTDATAAKTTFVSGGLNVYGGHTFTQFISGTTAGNILFRFPAVDMRVSASDGNPTDKKKAYFGADTTLGDFTRYNKSTIDLLRVKPAAIDDFTVTSGVTEYSWVFSLDNLSSSNGVAVHVSGARAGGTSYRGTSNYSVITETLGADRFTSVFYGGFDGLDIKEKEPFNNTDLSGSTELTSYAHNSIKMAIDMCREQENVEFDIACIPGITNYSLVTTLLDMCTARRDCMAIVDLAGDYTPETENTNTAEQRVGSVTGSVSTMRTNGWDTSYGATYYPWVQVRDTISGATLWVPPSVVALGSYAYAKKVSQVWFSPAGFTRGGLGNGAGGLPVINVRQRLTKDERDKLYDARINPIAKFPAEGIVILGQKTLQARPSALDRVNVRRLVNHIKKNMSRFAATLLFEPNVQQTWNRYRNLAEPFLDGIKADYGLADYKLVLDETTTTPDLIDRNAIYAKLYIKPAKAVEFFAIDVVITNSSAGFDD